MTYARLEKVDAVKLMETIMDESVDLIVTDPPYESLERHRKKGTTTRLKKSKASSNDWFPIFTNDRFIDFFKMARWVLKPNSHLYMFCDQETMFHIKPIGEDNGFKFHKPIIWDKVNIGMGYHYRCRYECILFFEKGKRNLNDLAIPDVLQCKRIHNGYPTEKPVPLLQILIQQSSSMGETVLDPFMGSGSIGVAAALLGRKFIGGDIQDESVMLTTKRLGEISDVVVINRETAATT